MIQLLNPIKQIATDDYYIQHMQDGFDWLCFDLQLTDPAYAAIQEERRILETSEGQTFRVKKINGGAHTAKIYCQLDLHEWQSSMLLNYNSGTRTAAQILTAIKPANWTVVSEPSTKKRVVEMDAPTPLEIVEQLQKTFGCAVRFDNRLKRASIRYPDDRTLNPLSTSYVVDSVNMRSAPQYKGQSTKFYTRLYPIGKDGLTITAVNNGVPYINNNDYCQDIVCAVWKDERYIDAASLLADATERLALAAQPERSWKIDVVDLKRLNPSRWSALPLDLFTVLKLVDRNKGATANVMVCEDRVYPYYPEKNEITVSTRTASVQRTLQALQREIDNPNSEFYQRLNRR